MQQTALDGAEYTRCVHFGHLAVFPAVQVRFGGREQRGGGSAPSERSLRTVKSDRSGHHLLGPLGHLPVRATVCLGKCSGAAADFPLGGARMGTVGDARGLIVWFVYAVRPCRLLPKWKWHARSCEEGRMGNEITPRAIFS